MQLPSPLQAYFDADAGSDPAAFAAVFTADATVADDGHRYRGHDAIVAWWREAQTKFSYIAEPFDIDRQDDDTIVRAKATGSFPGSPLTFTYRFRTADGRVSFLEITL